MPRKSRGYATLPTSLEDVPVVVLEWTSSVPELVSDKPRGNTAAGVLTRRPPGAGPAKATLTACASDSNRRRRRDTGTSI